MSIFKYQRWGDGEEISHDDLTAISPYLESKLWDTLASIGRHYEEDDVSDANVAYDAQACFATHAAAAAPDFNSAFNRRVYNPTGGVIMQVTASGAPSGDGSRVMPYYVAPGEINVTLADNTDPSHDRWDLIAVKVDQAFGPMVTRDFKDAVTGAETSQTVQPTVVQRLTVQVVPGTPAASPVEPALPAGYVRWAAVLVPHGIGANPLSNSNSQIRDYRHPLGFRTHDVFGRDLARLSGVGTLVSLGQSLSLNAGDVAWAVCRVDSPARILGVRMYADLVNPPTTLELKRVPLVYGTGVSTTEDLLLDVSGAVGLTGGSHTYLHEADLRRVAFSGASFPTAALWTSGRHPAYGAGSWVGLKIVPGTGGGSIHAVRFLLAGSL